MTKCKKCGHIGQPKTKKRFDGVETFSLSLLMFPLWFVSFYIIMQIGVHSYICDWYMLPSNNCFIGTLILSTVLTLIYIVTLLYKSKQMIEVCEKCGERIEEEKVE